MQIWKLFFRLPPMTITSPIISLIVKRFRDPTKPQINQSQLANYMGYGKAWASKLLKGNIKNLTDEQADRLEEFLGIRLRPYLQETGKLSALAAELGEKMERSPELTNVVAALLGLFPPQPVGLRWIETSDMSKVGQEIIRIAYANDDKPGKVARLVLQLLDPPLKPAAENKLDKPSAG